jgi:NAD(P)-dependent dehydrogenase (short-subunit alcohol dehydrogenase family)
MDIQDTVALVTGANRGLGRALVEALLERGARKVYAASRDGRAASDDGRVVAVRLDVADPAQVRAAATAAGDVRLLINNAGTLASMSVLTAEPQQVRRDLEVNFLAVLEMARAFLPHLTRGGPAAIANVLSVASLASMPSIGGYSASKAAAWSLTQALRAELRPLHVAVHAAFPGPIDTDMIRSFEMPKTGAPVVARAIVEGIAAGIEDIAPDPMSVEVLATFLSDPRAVAQKFAA